MTTYTNISTVVIKAQEYAQQQTQQNFEALCTLICTSDCLRFNYKRATTNPTINTVFDTFFKNNHITLPIFYIRYTLRHKDCTHLIMYVEAGHKFDTQQTNIIFSTLNSNLNTAIHQFINKYYSQNVFAPDPETFKLAIYYGLYDFTSHYVHELRPTQQHLYDSITNGNLTFIKTLLLLGATLNTSCLEMACSDQHIDIIKFFLENKISPTTLCFANVLKPLQKPHPNRFYTHPQLLCTDSNTLQIIINLLISYGYKLSYQDLLLATSRKITINNFQDMDIKLDDTFIKTCLQEKFFPPYFNAAIPSASASSSTLLEDLCNKPSNLPSIKKLVSQGVKPTQQCLLLACRHKRNKETIRYLIETCHLKPTIDCIRTNLIVTDTLAYIIDEYEKTLTPPTSVTPPPQKPNTKSRIKT